MDNTSAPRQENQEPTEETMQPMYGQLRQDNDAPRTPPKFDASLIYPEPIKPGLDVAGRPPSDTSKLPMGEGKNSIVSVVVTILGLYITVSPFVSFFVTPIIISLLFGNNVIQVSGQTLLLASFSNPMTILSAVFYVLVGIGIILRKELARIAYIILVIISLIMSITNFYSYTQVVHASGSIVAEISSDMAGGAAAAQTEARQQHQLQSGAREDSAATPRSRSSTYSSIIFASFVLSVVAFLINIVLLIFFTRPSVKKLFR